MRQVFVVLLFLASLSLAGQPQVIDKVAAIVGEEVILLSDLEVQKLQLRQQGVNAKNMDCELLNEQLASKMLVVQAQVDSIQITEGEVESELDRRIQYFVQLFGGDVAKMEATYGKTLLQIKDEFRTEVMDQLLSQRMQAQITSDVRVTPREVRKYFTDIPVDSLPFFEAEVEVGQIVVYPKVNAISRKVAIDKANRLRESIINGKDFCTVAFGESDDPGTRDDCGDLPWFTRNDPYAKEFIGAAFRLEPGQVSPVTETEFGFHIIKMIDRKGERIKVRHILITPTIGNSDVQRARNVIDSIRGLLTSNAIDFRQGVAKFSEDLNTKGSGGMFLNQSSGAPRMTLGYLGQLDSELPFVTEKLEPGQYSEPLLFKDARGKQAWRIVLLRSETDAHVASLETDYSRIEQAALNEKKVEAFTKWLETRVKRTYIFIDPAYRGCPILKPWFTNPE